MDEEYMYLTITRVAAKLIEICLVFFLVLIILSIVSIILNIKRKNKKKVIKQIVLSAISLIGSFCIVGNSISLFGKYSDLYMGLVLLVIGNILTLINILKK